MQASFASPFDTDPFFTGHQQPQPQPQQQQQQLLHQHFAQQLQPSSATAAGLSGQSVYDLQPHGAADADSGLIGSNINHDVGAPLLSSPPLSSQLPIQLPSQLTPSHSPPHLQQQQAFMKSDFSSGAELDLSFFSSPLPDPQSHQQQHTSPQQQQQQKQQLQTDQSNPYGTPLFGGSGDLSANMASPHSQMHHNQTPPHLLNGNPGSASQSAVTSPSFPHFAAGGGHSRNVSLGPEAAMLPNRQPDWNRPQFHTHRRSISEFSDMSSTLPSPHMITHDKFDDHNGHSPLQQPSDPSMIMGLGSFSLSDQGASPSLVGRSPSHSPIPSPRLMPQPQADMGSLNSFGLGVQSGMLSPMGFPSLVTPSATSDTFPSLRPSPQLIGSETPQMAAPPIINVDYAPTNVRQTGLEPLNQDSLTPPDRGEPQHVFVLLRGTLC